MFLYLTTPKVATWLAPVVGTGRCTAAARPPWASRPYPLAFGKACERLFDPPKAEAVVPASPARSLPLHRVVTVSVPPLSCSSRLHLQSITRGRIPFPLSHQPLLVHGWSILQVTRRFCRPFLILGFISRLYFCCVFANHLQPFCLPVRAASLLRPQ